MAIGPGSRLGPYEVTALLGEGGMGKVWRAHHTGLNRDDALKVLPDAFASDPDRLARFQREAQFLASLNHPNIAHVYGLERSDGVQALVMELVEGPTLAERIARGPIPVDEALSVARQIAEALEVAHEQGVIHRDLKPANIKLTPGGTVKVLDFGLAKRASADAANPDLSHSPTVTVAGTRDGVILGTAAYMSPEQARARPVDKRTDIWAFGCVLYEMLTGRPAFPGATVSDTIAKILEREPDWQALPAALPERGLELLQRCLAKDLAERRRDMHDIRLELEQVVRSLHSQSARAATLAAAPATHRRRGWLWAAAALAAVALAAGTVWYRLPAAPLQVMRLNMDVSPASALTGLT